MATGQLSTIIRQLRRVVTPLESSTVSDAQLLERFVNDRDEVSFEVLMWRHGPMVLGVCRRLLTNSQDIEDVFQATFLALVRRANTIGKRESAGSWLYKVAFRAALRARKLARKRAVQEKPALDLPAVAAVDDPMWRDLRPVLDEAIQQLPHKYRLPIILCYFEGMTHAEAAQQLGWPKGTVSVRLLRARELLRTRLVRRGVTLSGGLLGTTLVQSSSAAVPTTLVTMTLKAAVIFNTSKAVAAGLLSKQAAALTEGIMRTMCFTRLKIAASIVLALAVLAGGAGVIAGRLFTQEPGAITDALPPAASGQPKEQLEKDVDLAIAKAVAYLKSTLKDGTWEHQWNGAATVPGGVTSLALLGLLEAGVKANDDTIVNGLAYLRSLPPNQTYVVALQTLVFCRADPKQDRDLIQRNVDHLLKTRSINNGRFIGWSYTAGALSQSDNSNTQYAVMALHAASKAGIQIDDSVWREIRDFQVRTQRADGGWVYSPEFPSTSTLTMTCAAVCNLAIARERLKEEAQALEEALAKGSRYIGKNFTLDPPVNQYYLLHCIARAGSLSGNETFSGNQANEQHNWYGEGARLLLARQLKNGAWHTGANNPGSNAVIDTSFALLFLARDGLRPAQARLPGQARLQDNMEAKLDQPISFERASDEIIPLQDVLEYLADRCAVKIVIDKPAFRAKGMGEGYAMPIRLPKLRGVSLGTVLEVTLKQANATYELKAGKITVIPPDDAKKAAKLPISERRKKMEKALRNALAKPVSFEKGIPDNTPLHDALNKLRRDVGLNIMIASWAFRDGVKPRDLGSESVSLAEVKNESLSTVLDLLLGPLDATFEIRDNLILIVPKSK